MPRYDDFWPAVACLLVLAGGVILQRRIQSMRLAQWAQGHGLRILTRERRFQRTGPFHGRQTNAQAVYRLRVQTADGVCRDGWVRLGHPLLGTLFSSRTVAVWDDEPARMVES